jgi:hypothetical protein
MQKSTVRTSSCRWTLAGAALVAFALSACSSNGDLPQASNTTLTQGVPSPTTPTSPMASTACAPAPASLVSDVTEQLNPPGSLAGAMVVASARSEQDGSGWPAYFLSAQLSEGSGGATALWAVTRAGGPPHVLALNALAEEYTPTPSGDTAALRRRLASDPEASVAAACS